MSGKFPTLPLRSALPLVIQTIIFSTFVHHCCFAEGSNRSFRKGTYAVFRVDVQHQRLVLVSKDGTGELLRSPARLEEWAAIHNKKVIFATNAGIFGWFHEPEGLYIEERKELAPLNSSEGSGNFYLKPNGVFYLADKKAFIIETSKYRSSPDILYASQSGPLLLEQGRIHPLFKEGSSNRTIRSGVGVVENGSTQVLFAISNGAVSFHDFAAFFKDELHCKEALYLDGLISVMHVPELNRSQRQGDFAAMFAVLEDIP